MTGKGTINDPYVCETWSELSSKSKTGTAYIKMADKSNPNDKVIDFAEIQPSGFTETIPLKGFIDFNGWTFKNFYSIARVAISVGGSTGSYSGRTMWANLNMKNFYHRVNSDEFQMGARFIEREYDNPNVGYSSMLNCHFYGELDYTLNSTVGVLVSGFIGKPLNATCNGIFTNCGFNVKARCNKSLILFPTIYELNSCRINLDINAETTTIIDTNSQTIGAVKNCRLTGYIKNTDTSYNVCIGNAQSMNSVYDIESNALLEYHGDNVSVFNSDKAESNGENTKFKACTTAQLANGSALQSNDFPCAVNGATHNHFDIQTTWTEGQSDTDDWETINPRLGYITTPVIRLPNSVTYIQLQLSAKYYKYNENTNCYELFGNATVFSISKKYTLCLYCLKSTGDGYSVINQTLIEESKLDEMLPIVENTTHIMIELRQNTYLNVPEVTEPSGDIIVVDSSSFFVGYEYLWELTDTKNELYIYNCLPEIDNLGAFANANNLTYISIPPSVKKIGRYSFRGTQLTSVRLARDCEYFPTSFPDNCEIFFYD